MYSLYVHIPFCKQRCFYCDFNSYCNKDSLIESYIEAVKKEIASYFAEQKPPYEFKTVYFGGGTPSYIDSKYIKEIMKLVRVEDKTQCEGATSSSPLTEITLELNPGTINKEKLIEYKEAGINRLSIGLQATQDDILKNIGRIHTLKEFDDAYNMAREVGFTNISVDLMFGLPNQTLENVNESLDYIIKINPEHISCYSLIVHDELVEKNPNAFKNLPTDEEERRMYYLICDRLKEAGYIQYEISNFAKEGFESKHNMCYWNQDEYIGVGAGASSYINNTRYKNIDDIEKYIVGATSSRPLIGKLIASPTNESYIVVEEVQTSESKLKEYMILQLRLIKGVSISKAKELFNIDILDYFKNEIEKLVNLELIKVEDDHVLLTKNGLDLANIVWEEFI